MLKPSPPVCGKSDGRDLGARKDGRYVAKRAKATPVRLAKTN